MKAGALIEELLDPECDGDVPARYRGREIELFQARGRLYPEKLWEFFDAIVGRRHGIVIGIGPRGGGKTMAASDAALARFLVHGDDVFQLGGSFDQAKRGFQYVRQMLNADSDLAESLEDFLKTAAVGVKGNWYKIAACSQKAARGEHPGDPHEGTGWQAHGGLLVLDERDEMDDEVAAAAQFSMAAANPGTVLITSTAHRDDGSGIALLEEQSEALGAKLVKWDCLDVCEVCGHDCAVCPGGRAFAGALFGGKRIADRRLKIAEGARTGRDRIDGTRAGADGSGRRRDRIGTVATAESVAGWEAFKREVNWPADEAAYCTGKAKLHRAGHLRLETIFRMFKAAPSREAFEVEMMCRRRGGARNVCDAAKLDGCLDRDAGYLAGYETVATIDWGLKGWAVLIALQRQNTRVVAVDCQYLRLAPVGTVLGVLQEWRDAYGVYEVWADASHPYENLEVASAGFAIHEVAFASKKELGAGWIRGMVERGELGIPGWIERGADASGRAVYEYRFPSDAMRNLWRQLRRWRRDKNGKIVKGDDHGCDSLLCAAERFAVSAEWVPDSEGSGMRASFGLSGPVGGWR